MTVTSGGRDLVRGRRSRPTAALLLLSAAGAWTRVMVAVSHGMGAMSGSMGLGVVAFVGVWTLMMAAMMLPGVAPFASFYTRRIHRTSRTAPPRLRGRVSPRVGREWGFRRMVSPGSPTDSSLTHATAATALAVMVFLSCGRLPADAVQGSLSRVVSFAARFHVEVLRVPRSRSRPPCRRAPRSLLHWLLLGAHAGAARVRTHERVRDARGRGCRARREDVARRRRIRPRRRCGYRSCSRSLVVVASVDRARPALARSSTMTKGTM